MSCTSCIDKYYPPNETNTVYITCEDCGRDLSKVIPRQRTTNQNKYFHKWLEEVADELNNSGQYVQTVLSRSSIDIPWDAEMVKRLLFHKIIRMKYEKTSSADLTTGEFSEAVGILSHHLATNCELDIPFDPKKDDMIK